ncbi:hypothetical protein JCGZ_05692 [Jatropha curcas]|uniref:DUF674 family protein n=1 Tax=Jatropha curcas TaxID=180498 RepID=A0A067LI30_JATCU|nr:uncharacterized protein LOC105628249 [Jatropha curcas]KDP44225.1 hypothetical protein JCGZ_05692 [Jatropha curcas]
MSSLSGNGINVNIRLKLLIDKNSNKVLCGEAGKDFVDFLFGLLQFPLGCIVGLLQENKALVSVAFSNILQSVQNLEDSFFPSPTVKQSLLEPGVDSSQLDFHLLFPKFKPLYHSSQYFGSPSQNPTKGYIKEDNAKYMVMDSLNITPWSDISLLTLINKFNIREFSSVEEKNVVVNFNKSLELLKASLESETVLTDVFLREE